MSIAMLMSLIISVAVTVFSVVRLGDLQEVISLGDLSVVLALSGVAFSVSQCFFRGPLQFVKAVWERVLYVVGVPIVALAKIAAVVVSISITIIRWLVVLALSLFLVAVALLYTAFPLDPMPEALLGCIGFADDALALITGFGLAFSLGKFLTFRIVIPQILSEAMRAVIPVTDFP